ncbi:NIPSNAP family protein [Piscinibacter sakaiensis]|uniref:NIPSNAP domain-containing protein n=1 Tax=Piscinibacter sakaiensis TaxID=1547922 RepID=A0A0K8P827_PISS1|nr:NIPSNAP family protein [Piscinibacter sakaiensis]GAP38355.1 hypothetical protein ISF6_4813 [Piscinibacter sakaiensis]
MIVDQRIYTLHPGKVPEWVAAMTNGGFAIQQPVLGRCMGYYVSEFGPLNQIVHLWGYDSLEDRAARRAELRSIPAWNEIRDQLMPAVHHQENRLLLPADFAKPAAWGVR